MADATTDGSRVQGGPAQRVFIVNQALVVSLLSALSAKIEGRYPAGTADIDLTDLLPVWVASINAASQLAPLVSDASNRLLIAMQDGADVALGARTDAAALSDTATASLIALVKRRLQRVAGTASIAHNTVSVGTAATTIVAARTGNNPRRSVKIFNLGAGTVFVGAASVTTANGYPILTNTMAEFFTTAALSGIVVAATSDVRYFEEFY